MKVFSIGPTSIRIAPETDFERGVLQALPIGGYEVCFNSDGSISFEKCHYTKPTGRKFDAKA